MELPAFRRLRQEVLALIRQEELRTEEAEMPPLAEGSDEASTSPASASSSPAPATASGARWRQAFARAGADLAILSSTADIEAAADAIA